MTEAQLREFLPFRDAPLFDESDPRSDSITSPKPNSYRSIRECSTLDQVRDSLRKGRYVPLGALRCRFGGQEIVVAYLGEVESHPSVLSE